MPATKITSATSEARKPAPKAAPISCAVMSASMSVQTRPMRCVTLSRNAGSVNSRTVPPVSVRVMRSSVSAGVGCTSYLFAGDASSGAFHFVTSDDNACAAPSRSRAASASASTVITSV
jgi:hypothetical protein